MSGQNFVSAPASSYLPFKPEYKNRKQRRKELACKRRLLNKIAVSPEANKQMSEGDVNYFTKDLGCGMVQDVVVTDSATFYGEVRPK